MRREPLLAVGFLLAGVGEIVRAAVDYVSDTLLGAAYFLAGAGLLLAAGGYLFLRDAAWAVPLGIAAAALGHVAALGLQLGSVAPDLDTLAAVALVLGLAVAAWATRGERLQLGPFRAGLALAAVGAIVAAAADIQQARSMMLLGNAFMLVGLALCAAIAAVPKSELGTSAA